jgi:putative glutamine amidotransferase
MDPLIAIPCRRDLHPQRGLSGDGVAVAYIRSIADGGGIPFLVPLLEDTEGLRHLYDQADGILLTGGEDVNPLNFGAAPSPKLGRIDPLRDQIELAFARWCVADRKPLLGICRGLQLINVAMGGSLYQDLESERGAHPTAPLDGSDAPWGKLLHQLEILPDSRLGRALGCRDLATNSLHHQAIQELGIGLRIVATSPTDGVIEGIEGDQTDHFLVAVQCHPETLGREIEPRWRGLFSAFVEAAATWRKRSREPVIGA